MQRRKFIAGLGSLTAAAAAGIGTGAFTSVSADRTVTVNTTGDESALLQFQKATNDVDGTEEVTANADQYVTLEEGGKVSFNFNGSDEGGSGVNKDAETIFDDLVDIVNQGSQEVKVGVTETPDGLGVYSEGDDAEDDDATQDDATAMNFDNVESEQELSPGDRLKNIGIIVSDSSALDGGGEITFRAEAINNND